MEFLRMSALKPPTLSFPVTKSSVSSGICRSPISFAPRSASSPVDGLNRLSTHTNKKKMTVVRATANGDDDGQPFAVPYLKVRYDRHLCTFFLDPPLSNVTADDFAEMDYTHQKRQMGIRIAEFQWYVEVGVMGVEENNAHSRFLNKILHDNGPQAALPRVYAILTDLCLALRNCLSFGLHWTQLMPSYDFTLEDDDE